MSRDLHADVVTETEASRIRPRMLVKFEFDSGDLRLCTGYQNITFNSEVYTASGDFGSVSAITEETEPNANGVELTLSGIPSEWISIALSEPYKGRYVTIWDALLDSTGAIIGGNDGPIPHIFRCDVMRIEEGGDIANITLSAESILRRLETGSPATFRTQWQKKLYSVTDSGFLQVGQTQQSELFWGAEREL